MAANGHTQDTQDTVLAQDVAAPVLVADKGEPKEDPADIELDTRVPENTGQDVVILDEDEIPDGGWGWVVVAACGACNFMSFGVQQSFGIFIGEDLGCMRLQMVPWPPIASS
jgi:hypothetical protein